MADDSAYKRESRSLPGILNLPRVSEGDFFILWTTFNPVLMQISLRRSSSSSLRPCGLAPLLEISVVFIRLDGGSCVDFVLVPILGWAIELNRQISLLIPGGFCRNQCLDSSISPTKSYARGQSRLERELGFVFRGHFQIRFSSVHEVLIFSYSRFPR